MMNQQKLYQQAEINEAIQSYKTSLETGQESYPYLKEKELINKVKIGDAERAKALLNDLLGYVFFAEGNKFNVVRARALELCSLLSRAAMEGGASSDRILKVNHRFLISLQSAETLEDLCYRLQEAIDVLMQHMFHYVPDNHNELIKKAIRFISHNYARNLTLNDIALYVGLNSAYFSTLFKQITGLSFKEYVNKIRVEESKRLLSDTDHSIIDISLAVGFTDQSYFSKVFKRYTGLTPKQYR